MRTLLLCIFLAATLAFSGSAIAQCPSGGWYKIPAPAQTHPVPYCYPDCYGPSNPEIKIFGIYILGLDLGLRVGPPSYRYQRPQCPPYQPPRCPRYPYQKPAPRRNF